jgi:bifunctional UDP-N-acetylglucosamine pyrophosphorylase/glucosamine-1-phosphate N-acetyltransferase
MAKNSFSAIVLAAGKGTRMKSPLPKVLHPVAGSPMIKKAIDAVRAAGAEEIRVVLGHGEALVRRVVEPMGATCYVQQNQWGTADAVRAADPGTLKGDVMILNGDHPLLTPEMIERALAGHRAEGAAISVVTAILKKPGSLGRVVRQHGEVRAIVEALDASSEALKIQEVNTGIYVATADALADFLPRIKNYNAKKEFYLTDIVAISQESDERVAGIPAPPAVAFGVNSQEELARATRILFARKARALMAAGVLLIDPRATYVEDEVAVGPGTVLYPGAYLRGKTRVGSCCVIEPNCYLANARVDDGAHVRAGSYLEEATLLARSSAGPYARLRPGTEIGVEAHVGNFVEMKKTKFGARSKAGHLTYLGDATIGEDVNVGCGTITCNYAVDRGKYRTKIGNRVFIGSDSQFVAPVEIGDDAVIGSGSTITKDVPARALAVARGKQVIKENYVPAPSPDAADPGFVPATGAGAGSGSGAAK